MHSQVLIECIFNFIHLYYEEVYDNPYSDTMGIFLAAYWSAKICWSQLIGTVLTFIMF